MDKNAASCCIIVLNEKETMNVKRLHEYKMFTVIHVCKICDSESA